MKLGYYPGCSLKGTSIEYKESVRAVCKAFDIQLVEIPDWNCCGATAAHNMNKELSLSLPARILALAEREGLTDIVVPCAACYNRLTVVQHELNEHKNYRDRVKEIIEMDFKGTTNVLNVVQLIQKYMIDKLQYKLVKPFNYKAACYYGCLLVRPHNILNFDRVEDPQSMDEIIGRSGVHQSTGNTRWNVAEPACRCRALILYPNYQGRSLKMLMTVEQSVLSWLARCVIQTSTCAARISINTLIKTWIPRYSISSRPWASQSVCQKKNSACNVISCR